MKNRSGMTKFEVLACTVVVLAIAVGVASLMMLDVTGDGGSGLRQDFVFDVSELIKVDPALILYDEVGSAIATGLEGTSAITIDSQDNIYVAGAGRVVVFDKGGQKIREFAINGKVRGLSVILSGFIYAGYKDHVEMLDRDGKVVSKWESLGDRAVITSIAIGEADVFVADAGNRVVVRYDLQGNVVNYIGRKDADRNIPGFVISSAYFDLAIADDGLLRVVNPGAHHIEAYTFDGDLEFSWGKPSAGIKGFCGCCNPVNFAITSNGDFITCEKGLTRVKVYDEDGVFVGVVAGTEQLIDAKEARICETPAQCKSGGFDVAVDSEDRVYVLDTQKNTVRIFQLKDAVE